MSESAQSINRFQHRVARRKRLLSLQDNLAVAVFAGGLVSAAAVLYVKLRPLEMSAWVVVAVVAGAIMSMLVARWFMTRASESDAAFEIDRKLGLEDRVATALSIIKRGGPGRAVEEALLDDAACRISGVDESSVVPYRFPGWYATSIVGVVALIAALTIPQKTLPGGESLLAEKADIESAGEQLEQAAKEVEQFVPPETVTANLAKEQAELGRALKRSADTRAEALKKLTELEGRIRQRRDELAETKADEIVGLAEKRLRPAVAPTTKEAQGKTESKISDRSENATPEEENAQRDSPQGEQASNKEGDKQSADQQSTVDGRAKEISPSTPPQSTPADRKDAKDAKDAQAVGQAQDPKQDGKPIEPPPSQSPATSETPALTPEQGDQKKPEADQESSNPISNMVAEQAARALPSMSEELLKKAGQLRAGDLKPEDIQQMARAAESLARDLAPIAQSKEFQQALQQLARQVDPEQLERVARELLSQENVRRELEAAARLLAQNRQAREIAAGIARQFGQTRPREAAPGADARNAKPGQGAGRGSSTGRAEKLAGENKISGRGREDKLGGKLQKKDGGEYLFLQTRPEVGAARVPYSSAYPRYRREAERSVERSQIPANMRRVVRSYFDAINPDAGKKQ